MPAPGRCPSLMNWLDLYRSDQAKRLVVLVEKTGTGDLCAAGAGQSGTLGW